MASPSPALDLASLLEAAADFASYPGLQNDVSAKQFLDLFPLPVLLRALQNAADVPGSEDTIVACLDKLFKTKYGASLLPQYVHFVQAGLQANSETVKCLACKAVSYLLEEYQDNGTAVQMIVEYHIYPLLINCLLDGNEQTSAASMNAIRSIAQSPEGIDVIFPSSSQDSIQLRNVAANCPSLARIRILALVAKLFSLSSSVASAVYNSNLIELFEVEINSRSDMLTTLSALELLYELVESPHSTSFLLRSTLLQLLTELISNFSVDSILTSRAILISGRLLSSSEAYTIIDKSSISSLLSAIYERMEPLDSNDTDVYESALEALGKIGSSTEGAAILLGGLPVVARQVVESAFTRQGRGIQLAALLALGDICGADRPEDSRLLNDNAEDCLKHLIYGTATNSPKLTPSGLLLSVLKKDPEIRLAAYRLISGLAARSWCMIEICSRQEIIAIITDANIESTKNGMEARHHCCVAVSNALSASNMLQDASVAGTVGKLQEAVKRGPYLAKKRVEAQPLVITAERF